MPKGRLPRDQNNAIMQLFKPGRVQAVTANVEWVPDPEDRAFLSPIDVNYTINSETQIPLAANRAVGIEVGYKFTFDTTGNIEVM